MFDAVLRAQRADGVDDDGRGHVRGEVHEPGVPVPIDPGKDDDDGLEVRLALVEGDFRLRKIFVFSVGKNVCLAQLFPQNSPLPSYNCFVEIHLLFPSQLTSVCIKKLLFDWLLYF